MNPFSFYRSMKERSNATEIMDRCDCDEKLLQTTILQFAFTNRFFSASHSLIKQYFFTIMNKNPDHSYTLLDLGAGGCDIDIMILKMAEKQNISITITAIDHDERVLKVAQKIISSYSKITLVKSDVNNLSTLGEFDFIHCNHLLHHLTNEEIGKLLIAVEKQSRIAYLLNDLHRSIIAYVVFTVFAALFLKRSLSCYDGRISIRKGFTHDELKKTVSTYLPGIPVKIIRAFPHRLVVYRSKI